MHIHELVGINFNFSIVDMNAENGLCLVLIIPSGLHVIKAPQLVITNLLALIRSVRTTVKLLTPSIGQITYSHRNNQKQIPYTTKPGSN